MGLNAPEIVAEHHPQRRTKHLKKKSLGDIPISFNHLVLLKDNPACGA